ncbi:MAG: type II toxin-antitoxin system prevent-host-death family antitoxin [Actinomycetales bacterium]|nr:MAG: type II toxin-antitoxin system prevent-host-death family antitoxin [Actinomycetales bacterium]
MAKARKKNEKAKQGRSAGVRELRQSASKLLAQVSTGEIIEITDRGNLIARLVPPTKSLYEEFLTARLIKAPRDPHHVLKIPTQKYVGDKPLSQLLLDNRAAARF